MRVQAQAGGNPSLQRPHSSCAASSHSNEFGGFRPGSGAQMAALCDSPLSREIVEEVTFLAPCPDRQKVAGSRGTRLFLIPTRPDRRLQCSQNPRTPEATLEAPGQDPAAFVIDHIRASSGSPSERAGEVPRLSTCRSDITRGHPTLLQLLSPSASPSARAARGGWPVAPRPRPATRATATAVHVPAPRSGLRRPPACRCSYRAQPPAR